MSQAISFSAIQPSGDITIGNYIGALRQWVELQNTHNCIYCIVDLHAVTNYLNVNQLRSRSIDVLALCLACGINPDISTIFMQSHVHEHCQLNWLLNCHAYFGEMCRMTQFKSRMKRNFSNISLGVFNYPILMAADILLYQANYVPIGEDQKQHLELCRSIASRFNSMYSSSVFTIPDAFIPESGSRIMSLLEPTKKMSKSDVNQNNVIALLDDLELVEKKIYAAVTDSDNPPLILYDPVHKPGISNLLEILSVFTGKSVSHLESMFMGKMYVHLKQEVIKELTEFLMILQNRYRVFRQDEKYLFKVLYNGAKKARCLAKKTLKNVYDVVGFIDRNIY
ncbi:tryptophan--tRNA ligase [Blochmannia endosymbiont of Polyrhachis (Hedomyrma) turneri]|uniref:tryptophan--tRNA ligase n=1 Tax=Blochmannia endosymbiont of Polyrhachis (Hedomyrma) turneri TaxID=1505596 RepID=UPI00061A6049|nr:tryptophan--tRNA ligase [Blochmannia endosymbiont of Polyrhachis (Hedomyrma) turneri]AKC60127.1 tryptophan-tRNA ligase [Blochmannia endosymbiont of Polyrhachis (Hedomyrma) turneri]